MTSADAYGAAAYTSSLGAGRTAAVSLEAKGLIVSIAGVKVTWPDAYRKPLHIDGIQALHSSSRQNQQSDREIGE
jgi:hypothetical protein